MIDHDRLFKELIATFFLEFLELFLPQVVDSIQQETVRFLPQEYFADLTTGENKIIDLLAEVQLIEAMQQDSKEVGFLIHIESQSYSQTDFAQRMFFYFARLYQKYRKRIYPVVVFSFDTPDKEEPRSHWVEFPDLRVLEFNFASIQLNQMNWREYLNQRNPVAAALMAKMKIAKQDRPKVKAECLRMLATLRLNPARTRLISGFVDTYLRLNAQEMRAFREEVDRLETREREDVMKITTSWAEEAERSLVLRLLSRKVGDIPEAIQTQIDQLTVEQIEALAEDLLDFNSLADLENWLSQN